MGGKSAPAPDYTPLANASKEAARIMAEQGDRQLAFAQRQYEEMAPLSRRIAEQQMASQDELMQMGREDRQYQIETFRPTERGLVADAERFSTEGYRESMAREAAAQAGRAFGINQQASERAAASRGINPASGAAMAMQQQNMLGLSAQRAAGMTGARQQAEQLGFARRMDVTGLGRGLSGSALGAYGAATGAGSAGLQTSMAPGTQYMQGMGQAASTIGQGQQMQLGGLTSIVGNQANLYGQKMNAQSQMLGTAVGVGTGLAIVSDRRLKENIELV